jgi:hypothetical protein
VEILKEGFQYQNTAEAHKKTILSEQAMDIAKSHKQADLSQKAENSTKLHGEQREQVWWDFFPSFQGTAQGNRDTFLSGP